MLAAHAFARTTPVVINQVGGGWVVGELRSESQIKSSEPRTRPCEKDTILGRNDALVTAGAAVSAPRGAAVEQSPAMAAQEEPMTMTMTTAEGVINFRLRADAAPDTVQYITKCVHSKLYDGREFYRSDFVIQCGLHGSGVANPHGDLSVNETTRAPMMSNVRGTCSIAHWDVPDCGNTEFFVNLQHNAHLDEAYGGYCVFAEVADDASFAVVDRIAAAVKGGTHTKILKVIVQ